MIDAPWPVVALLIWAVIVVLNTAYVLATAKRVSRTRG